MHSADARAGQHRISRFRDHRQIDRDTVALLNAVLLQHIGEAADILMQFAIGDLLVDIGIVAFPDDRNLITTALQVAVDTVIGNVGNAVLIPFDGYVAVEIGVLDLGEGLEPVDAPSVLCPKAVRVAHAFLIPFEIGCVVDERVSLCLGKDRVKLFRHDFLLQHSASRTISRSYKCTQKLTGTSRRMRRSTMKGETIGCPVYLPLRAR